MSEKVSLDLKSPEPIPAENRKEVNNEKETVNVSREVRDDRPADEKEVSGRTGCGKLVADGCVSGCFTCLFFYVFLMLGLIALGAGLFYFGVKLLGSIFSTDIPA